MYTILVYTNIMDHTVLFVRNGESIDNILTDLGGVQSRCVANYIDTMLRAHNIKTVNIYSSHKTCSINTAICLVHKWDVPLNISGSLHECSEDIDIAINEFRTKSEKNPIIVYTDDKCINYVINSLKKTQDNCVYDDSIYHCSISAMVYNNTTSEWEIKYVSDTSHLGTNITH